MSKSAKLLREVRSALAASDRILREARDRRTRVLEAARAFNGVRGSYNSGSIAHGTANSDLDADCGVILDRRTYPDLGPDGEGDGPNELLAKFRDYVSDRLGEDDDAVEVRLTRRRAIKTSFHQEVDGVDPSVDLVMGLERKSPPGLWIPNRPEDSWDPAHPAKHTELFTSGAPDLVTARARAIRLMKGWNAQYANPGLSSFNIEALAWECIEEARDEAEALAELFRYAAKELAGGETDDPAGVSGTIRLLIDQDEAVGRLEKAAELLRQAVDQDEDEEAVQEALAGVFWDYVTPAEGSTSKAAFADALRRGKTVSVGQSGLSIGAAAGNKPLKRTRSYGDGPGR